MKVISSLKHLRRVLALNTLVLITGCMDPDAAQALLESFLTNPPTINSISSQTLDEDTTMSVNFTVSNSSSTNIDCTATYLSITSSDTTILDPADVIWSGSGGNCNLSITPKANANGSLTITLTAAEGSNSASVSFAVTVNPVTDVQSYDIATYNNLAGVHSCFVINNNLRCQGANASGQLGDGTYNDSSSAISVSGFQGNTTQVVTNYRNTCALKTDGTVWCWGHGSYGQNGNGSNSATTTPVQVIKNSDDSNLTDIVELAGGYLSNCARDNTNQIWCWGSSLFGMLGDNTTAQKNKAVQVLRDTGGGTTLLNDATQLSGNGFHYCVVRSDNSPWCWGRNNSGQLGNNSTTTSLVAIQSMKYSGGSNILFTDASKISAGYGHTCAIDTSNGTWCWGSGAYGILGIGHTSTVRVGNPVILNSNDSQLTASDVSAGYSHTCAVGTDTKAYCWGQGLSGELGNNEYIERYFKAVTVKDPINTSNDMSGFTDITVGHQSTCAVNNDTIYCWGANHRGNLAVTTISSDSNTPQLASSLPNVKTLAKGGEYTDLGHYCAILDDGNDTLNCWGLNVHGQLGNGLTTSSGIVTVRNETDTGNLQNVTDVSTGAYNTCAIVSGQIYCWGEGRYSVNGNNSTADSSLPVKVLKSDLSEFNDAVSVSVGAYHACAIDSADQAWCWGTNSYGALGDLGTVTTATAVEVYRDDLIGGTTLFNTASKVYASDRYSCAVDTSNQAWCWGFNNQGMLGNNTQTNSSYAVKVLKDNSGATDFNDVTSLHAGYYNVCAIDTSENLWCWGNGSYYKQGNGSASLQLIATPVIDSNTLSQLGSISDVDVSSFSACAVDTSNQLWCWGQNYTGSIPSPVAVNNPQTRAIEVDDPSSAGSPWADVSTVSLIPGGGCALTTSSQVYCWGDNSHGEYANSTISSTSVPSKTNYWD